MKKSKQICNTSLVMQDEEVRKYLKDLQKKFVSPPLTKHRTTCKKLYVSKLLVEVEQRGTQSDTYKLNEDINKRK